ncbi:DUF1329 domain-containing protein [Aromatoleum toluolicum]|uniref:DUF1329 domain-containing protein n=1 Tax=Aromatoleum toluolicum TaxID=90060 RepID=A0ABX1NLR4_9RHOO|nr:DUF1329 domain-containing protein [Aromatoleum toluolicum]NMG00294.1 DUF1329 domain-containing protein [Aromatoleum toluolicum]
MKFTHTLIATATCCAFLSGPVAAALTAAEADRLGRDLTASGAEKAGNKDGSIPAWNGGLTKPPAGWQAEAGYADPFADEKPAVTINAANADQYKDRLPAGLSALLKKYPTFSMPVYPTHRTAALPQAVLDQAKAESTKISMNKSHIEGREGSHIPFPIPKNGEEAMYNHLLRYTGGGFEREYAWFPVRASGDTYKAGVIERVISPKNFEPVQREDLAFAFYAWFTTPATLDGQVYLVHEPVDQVKEARSAWIYNSGLRRVRRAPDFAYDNIADGTEGMRTTDQYYGFNGATDRYDWKLVGKKELYVPYNTYRIGDKKLKYADILDRNTVKSDLMRYELHRVWVVEATLKEGQKHVYGRRTFYLDEDSWMVLVEDAYDTRGQLWRVGVHGFRQNYDAVVPWQSVNVWHDLSNGNYMAGNLDNEVKLPIRYGIKARWSDFQPDALRRAGTR